MAFWGVTIPGNGSYTIPAKVSPRSIRITQASNVGPDSLLNIKVGNNPPISLVIPKGLTRMKLYFRETEDVTLSVKCPTAVHLVGYYQQTDCTVHCSVHCSSVHTTICKNDIGSCPQSDDELKGDDLTKNPQKIDVQGDTLGNLQSEPTDLGAIVSPPILNPESEKTDLIPAKKRKRAKKEKNVVMEIVKQLQCDTSEMNDDAIQAAPTEVISAKTKLRSYARSDAILMPDDSEKNSQNVDMQDSLDNQKSESLNLDAIVTSLSSNPEAEKTNLIPEKKSHRAKKEKVVKHVQGDAKKMNDDAKQSALIKPEVISEMTKQSNRKPFTSKTSSEGCMTNFRNIVLALSSSGICTN